MTDVRVCGDRVLVALPPDEDEITSDSGIVLVRDPDLAKTPTRGIVVRLGEKSDAVDVDEVLSLLSEDGWNQDALVAQVKRLGPAPFDVAVGDCVLFSAGAGDQFEQDGIDYVILREADILGVVEPIQKEAA